MAKPKASGFAGRAAGLPETAAHDQELWHYLGLRTMAGRRALIADWIVFPLAAA